MGPICFLADKEVQIGNLLNWVEFMKCEDCYYYKSGIENDWCILKDKETDRKKRPCVLFCSMVEVLDTKEA